MFGNGQEFEVSEPHLMAVVNKFVRKIAVVHPTVIRTSRLFPRTKVDFVDTDRLIQGAILCAFREPIGVIPREFVQWVNNRCGSRWDFTINTKRVGFIDDPSIKGFNTELVLHPHMGTRYKQLPDSRRYLLIHGMGSAIPIIEVTNDLYRLRIGCPESEVDAALVADATRVCT